MIAATLTNDHPSERRASSFGTKWPKSLDQIDALVKKGRRCRRARRFAEATHYICRALELHENYAPACYELVELHASRGAWALVSDAEDGYFALLPDEQRFAALVRSADRWLYIARDRRTAKRRYRAALRVRYRMIHGEEPPPSEAPISEPPASRVEKRVSRVTMLPPDEA